MATRLSQRAVRRMPLPLTDRDLADLAKLREPGVEREALAALTPGELPEGELTEAALLHAVFEAGLRAVRDAAEERSYAADAAAYERADAERRRTARRRRPSWSDED